jgi:succinoglycan biosynthesis protein ExoM
MSIIVTRITIGVTTFRRTSLGDTLISLSRLVLPLDTTLTILVADRDGEPSAQTTIASLAAEYGLAITYLHTPGATAEAARNTILKNASGDYLAFLDDNTIADPAWLSELLGKQRSSGADIVLGPVHAIYAPTAPRWVRMGNFHSLYPGNASAYTHNMLMGSNATGNATITVYAPGARLYTPIAPAQATLTWLMPYYRQQGEAYATQLLAEKRFRPWHMLLATIRMLKSYALVLLSCLSPFNRRRWLLQGTLQLAVLRTLWHNS